MALVTRRRVLAHASQTGVIDPNDDGRLDLSAFDHFVGSDVRAPILASECGSRIEDVLAVLQVQNRVARFRLRITWRNINDQVAAGRKKFRRKARMQVQSTFTPRASFMTQFAL